MKLYHYVPKENTVLQDGLLTNAKNSRDLTRAYAHRCGSENREDILRWLDSTFAGRSRSISCLTEPIQWQGNDPILKKLVDNSVLFSFNLDELIKDGLVESIWCKNGSSPDGCNEVLFQVQPEEIQVTPLSWGKVDASKSLLYAVVRHYMVVLKDGVIPPQYLTLEN